MMHTVFKWLRRRFIAERVAARNAPTTAYGTWSRGYFCDESGNEIQPPVFDFQDSTLPKGNK